MKKSILTACMAMVGFTVFGQHYKKDGTPDRRYSENKSSYSSTPNYNTEPKQERNYNNGGSYKLQEGYQKSNGTYVAPHIKTNPDNYQYNNKNYNK